MQTYTRAGLVALILAFTIVFTTAAPIVKHDTPSVSVRTADTMSINHAMPIATVHHGVKVRLPKHHSAIDYQENNVLERRKVSAKVKHAFQKVGHAFKHAAQKVGNGIKHAAQKVAKGVKTAAKKVGHFVKTTGAQIAKFGLKLASTAQKVASKVVSFIPGVGKIAGKALEGVSAGLNAASNAIHVKLPKRLQKGVNAMNKVRKISGYVPRELSEFEERDVMGFDLDTREDFYDLYEREWDEWEDS